VTRIAHFEAARVIVGVDTHKDNHVAVAIDDLGGRLGEHWIPTTTTGSRDLVRWAGRLGDVVAFGVEGTGSYGAGLSRFLAGCDHKVIEVNRPDRSVRRRLGKSDSIDAESAARSVLAGTSAGTPKSGTGNVEMIRALSLARSSAVKACSQASNQLHSLVTTAPAGLQCLLTGLSTGRLVKRCSNLRPGKMTTNVSSAKFTLRSIARRHQYLAAEIRMLDVELKRLTEETAPELTGAYCIGPNTAAALLIAAGDNPERMKSEAAFAALCGVSPVPASSGKTSRHRLNRGGDRRANAALHQIVIVRLRHDARTRAYMERRTKEGKGKMEVIRCLKRHVAREVFKILRNLNQNSLNKAA
jgi:transposase